nr:hypothetical protein [uncultured Fluviicola sp.]
MINWKLKDFSSPPPILRNSERLIIQKNAEVSKNGDLIKPGHYRPSEVVTLLKAYSIGKASIDEDMELAKCFYCESNSEVVASLQVEHYRPKGAIHDSNRKVLNGSFGYYWLGLEWSNLILSCSKCNGRGAKGNIFTTMNSNIFQGTSLNRRKTRFDGRNCRADQDPLKDEKPDLLHPEIDNSYKYLKFNASGEILPKLNRGKRTIEICKLDRRSLNIARANIVRQFQDSFLEVVEYERNGLIKLASVEGFFLPKCKKLRQNFKRELPYTLLSRYMLEEFEEFFVSIVPNPYKSYLRSAFIKSA